VKEILDSVLADGRAGLRDFVLELDAVASEPQEGGDRERFELLKRLVSRTVVEEREALGLGDELSRELVLSFFYEFGHSYLLARLWGHESVEQAVHSGISQLRTLDAARTFAVAAAAEELSGRQVAVAGVALLPGRGAPTAVAELRTQGDRQASERIFVVLRLEWGDWYVAQVQASALGSTG
jgi:hypothetical protein